MCSPQVMQIVKERLMGKSRDDVLYDLRRRNFLKASGLAAVSLAVMPSLPRPTPVKVLQEVSLGAAVDLSYVLGAATPMYGATDPVPTDETIVTVEDDGFFFKSWNFWEHSGTHLDAPAHFVAGAETVDQLAPGMFAAPLVVIDISAKAEEEADAMVTAEDIQAWEADNGEIPPGALVCMYSGWGSRWPDPVAYRNPDADGVMHFPGFGPDGAQFLVEERSIAGIGVDTLSQDVGASATFDVHYTILGAGKYGLENLSNLDQLIGKQATVFVGVPRYEAGSGGPCRVIAWVNE